jgi:hypothetical protein
MSANYFLGAPPLGQEGHLISLRIDDLSVYFEKKTGAEAMEIKQSGPARSSGALESSSF